MAKDEKETAFDINKPLEQMSKEELEKAVLLADAQAKRLNLDAVQEDNRKRLEHRREVSRQNEMRQGEMAQRRLAVNRLQSACRHKQGGFPHNILKGDGKPAVVKTKMLDGVTWLLICQRCRVRVLTPHPDLLKRDPEEYAKQKALYDKLWEMSEDAGLDPVIGPNFMFKKDGIPFVPEHQMGMLTGQ